MKLEHNKTGLKLDLENLSERLILTYTSEYDISKKVRIIIEPALNKMTPRLQFYVDTGEYSLFKNDNNEDLFCIVESGLSGNWTEVIGGPKGIE